MCKLLLASGADVLERDFFGRGALHYANNVKVARELLSSGADPALRDKHGQRADDLTSNHEARRFRRHAMQHAQEAQQAMQG
eukprot:16522-Heterococcus_DN1.PRE.3